MYVYFYMYTFFGDATTSGDLVALVASGWYFVYMIVDLGFIPVNKSSFSTLGEKKNKICSSKQSSDLISDF